MVERHCARSLPDGRAAASRLVHYLRHKRRVPVAGYRRPLLPLQRIGMANPAALPLELRIEHLSKTYGNGVKALDDVSLTIPQGM